MQRRQSDPRRRSDDPFSGIEPKDAPDLVSDIVANADLQVSGVINIQGGVVRGIPGNVVGTRGSIIFRGDQGVLVTEAGDFITFIDKARAWPLFAD